MLTLRSRSALSLLALLLVAAFTWARLRGGALQSDLGGDSDEPAHAVTSPMVRDYLAGITTHAPMAFARAYYADFPKVAIGHFPPLYYLVGGGALMVWPHRDTLLVIQWMLGVLVGVMTPDQVLLERTMKGVPQHWRLVRTQPITREPGVTDELLVYRAQR